MWLTGLEQEALVYQFAMIPANFMDGIDILLIDKRQSS
jgi:hypothetical protein